MFPHLLDEPDKEAVDMPDGRLSYRELAAASTGLGARLPAGPLALWASPALGTIVALVGALRAGVALVPINPKAGTSELAHILADAQPRAVLVGAGLELPETLAAIPRIDVHPDGWAGSPTAEDDARTLAREQPPPQSAALIAYTSGTTGAPKGVVHTRGSLAANLDALAEIWGLTSAHTIVHALPLFHVHGLVLGTIGPLRLGGRVRHVGGFDVERLALGLADGSHVLYAVPTMYQRLLAGAERDPRIAAALRRARLLVSGSAALAAELHRGIERATGQTVIERYGMTETLIITSTRPGEPSRPGYVGTPLPGVSVVVAGADGAEVPHDDATMGSVRVRGPSVFEEYADSERRGAGSRFDTGDLAVRAGDGALRLLGRSSSDLINSGGYRIAAAEIEAALVSHAAVSEAAVRGVPDAELGERVAAWVVLVEGRQASDGELVEHVVAQLTPHKRPREIHRVHSLPRNELGKVQKQRLGS